ncbi:ribose-phosphate pyrophosphokinase [Ramlibacter sp.]|uniref:ribose-phosphate diphosphokinase n=1 Tax=Ramlibacter sp. TaxID=1917967 RepID=UPI002B610745|nr:ribose-phosphate pyrophosphokinase [Ramlibacter sp.]HWI81134.1 ribose-phosphate pyrophosphokinase [Ramlibacter sp.]
MQDSDLALFALHASGDFGAAVARHLGTGLMPHEERSFVDGEHKARPLANVRGRDVFVLHSLYADDAQSVDDKLCRLLFFIGALKDASAASVTAIVPYLGYARKDQKSKPRDPVTTRYVAALFEAVGTDRVVTLDVHNLAAFQNAFRCRTEHLQANGLFVAHFAPLVGQREVVVVSPDAGGLKRAERFRTRLAKALGRPVAAAFAEKHRSEDVLTGDLMVGPVAGRCAIIIDDLIGSGSTIARTAGMCRSQGATAVYAAASHGLFVGEAAQLLADEALDRLVVTDSVPPFRLAGTATLGKLDVLPVSGLFAEAIHRMHAGESLVQLLEQGSAE